MIIQNQKLLLILAKIESYKGKFLNQSKLNIMVNVLRSLSLLYFMSIHAEYFPNNLLVINAQSFDQSFSHNQSLQLILSIILLVLHLSFLSNLIFLFFQSQKLLLQRQMKRKQLMIKFCAFVEALISTMGNTIAALLISVVDIKTLSSDHSRLLGLIAILLSVVNNYLIPNTFFSYKFFFILTFYDISSLFANIVLIIASLYTFYSQKSQILFLKVVDLMAVEFIAAELLNCEITTYQIILTPLLIVLIEYFKEETIFQIPEHENDFLIGIAEKLFFEHQLSIKQQIKVSIIYEKDKLFKDKFHIKSNMEISSQNYTRFGLFFQKLSQKIKKDINLYTSNNHIKLQQIQCHLVSNKISIKILKNFHEIRGSILNKSDPSQIKRLQLITNKIEKAFLKSSKDVNCLIIMAIESQLQKLYEYIGYGAEEMLIFWRLLAKNEADQSALQSTLEKVADSEKKSLQVIQNLKEQKNLSFEVKILNYFHKIINANPEPLISDYIPERQIKITDTTFLLISNNIIEQVSVRISKQLSYEKSLLVGNEMSILFQNPISSFLLHEMDRISLDLSQNNIIFLPFNFFNNNFKFIVYKCSFQLIPDLSKGIKFLVNVVDEESNSSFVLYNLSNDKILGFSSNIFINHRITQTADLSNIYGHELFNLDLSHLFKKVNGDYSQISCHFMLVDILKNFNYKHLRKNYSPHIILKVKQQYCCNNSIYLLLQILQENPRIRSSQRVLTYIQNMDQEYNPTINTKQLGTELQNQKFCKINNPLKTLVDEKLSKINSSFKISYYQIMVWLINFGTLAFACSLISLIITTKNTTQRLSEQFDQINKANDLRFNLCDVFQKLFQYHQIKQHPELFITNLNLQDATVEKESMKLQISTLIQECISSIYANSINVRQKHIQMVFNNYISKTKLNSITVMSLLSQVKKYLAQQDIQILIQNSKQAFEIINSYITPRSLVFDEFQLLIQYYMVGFLVLWGLIILGCQYIFTKIQLFKRKIFQIYSLITIQERDQYIQNLQQLLSYLLKISYSLKNTEDASISQSYKESEKVVQAIKQNKMGFSLVKTSIICLIPILFSLFQILMYTVVEDYNHLVNSVLQHNGSINSMLLLVKQQQMLYFQQSAKVQIMPDQLDKYDISNFQQLMSVKGNLPHYFDQYQKIQEGILNFQICSRIKIREKQFYKGIICQRVLEGALNFSLSQAYSLFIHKLIRTKLNYQINNKATNSYPFLIEIFYSGYYIEENIKQLQNIFRQSSRHFFINIQEKFLDFITGGFIIIFLGIVVLFIIYGKVSKICGLAFKTFSVLPRRSITKLSTSKQLKNMGILDEIGLIAI